MADTVTRTIYGTIKKTTDSAGKVTMEIGSSGCAYASGTATETSDCIGLGQLSVGKYIIDFQKNFSEVPAVCGSLTGNEEEKPGAGSISFPVVGEGYVVALVGGTTGAKDMQFSFIAVGQVESSS